MDYSVNPQSLRKKYDELTKYSKDILNNNDVNTYLLRVAKYVKNEFQNLQDLKVTGEGLVMFKIIKILNFENGREARDDSLTEKSKIVLHTVVSEYSA